MSALKQEVEGFHVVGEAQTLKKVAYPYRGEALISKMVVKAPQVTRDATFIRLNMTTRLTFMVE
jgi:hypothetical protein